MRKSVEVQVDSDFTLLLPSGIYEIKKMEPRRRLRSIVLICVILAVSGIIGFGYFCPDQVIRLPVNPFAHSTICHVNQSINRFILFRFAH